MLEPFAFSTFSSPASEACCSSFFVILRNKQATHEQVGAMLPASVTGSITNVDACLLRMLGIYICLYTTVYVFGTATLAKPGLSA